MSGEFNKIAGCRLESLAVAAALALWAAPACSQTATITYPSSRSLSDITAWLQRDTPLSPAQVIDVGPAAVTAILSASPIAEMRGFLANIASEAVDPTMLAHDGIASWSIPVEIDCDHRQVRLGTMTGYRSRDLRTDPRVVREADMAWVTPTASAPLGSAIRALCDRDYHRPLTGGRAKVASLAPAPVKPAPSSGLKAAAPIPASLATLRPSLPPDTAAVPVANAKPARKPVVFTGGGPFALQIGASPSLADTQALVAKFKKTFASRLGGLTAGIATVQVGGKTVNRALVSGLASAAEANAFCKTLAAAGQACFVRR
jgi:cell division septation protein DedD